MMLSLNSWRCHWNENVDEPTVKTTLETNAGDVCDGPMETTTVGTNADDRHNRDKQLLRSVQNHRDCLVVFIYT